MAPDRGHPLPERIDQATHRRLLDEAGEVRRPFVLDGGRVEPPIRGHLVVARRAG